MNLPDYVTIEEVQRVCRELGFRDWTQMADTAVLPEEARVLQALVGAEALQVPADEFQRGLEVELEHGITFPDANDSAHRAGALEGNARLLHPSGGSRTGR